MGRDSVVGIANSPQAGRAGVQSPVGAKDFLFARTGLDCPWGPLSPLEWAPQIELGVRRPGRGVDHQSPSSAEVRE